MKVEKDRIDRLLDKNATGLLARVDWDRLTDQISARLDQARQIETMPSRCPVVFKISAGIAAAAAVIFAVVVLRTQGPVDEQMPEGRAAVVEFVDRHGTASIKINDKVERSFVVVHAGHSDRMAAKCEVEIIDRNGDLPRESSRAAWIIISKPQQTLADNGHNKEEIDVICLL